MAVSSHKASSATQNIAPGSGPNSLSTPFPQFGPSQDTNGTLPAFAPQAGEATIPTMIARAEENNRHSPKIDMLWQDGGARWPANDNALRTGAPALTDQKTKVPDAVWSKLKAFKRASDFAVSI